MNKRMAILALVMSVVAVTGCGRRKTVVVHREGPTRRVAKHVCTRDCHHHYYDGRRIVVLEGHRHGPNCGHRWDGRRWVVAPRRTTKVVERGRTPDRHDYHPRGTKPVVVEKAHRHGPGCGHVWDGHRWVPAKTRPKTKPVIRR